MIWSAVSQACISTRPSWTSVHLNSSSLQISINQNEQTLKISGERQRAQSADKKSADGSDQKQQFRRQYERGMGKFQRTISFLPKDADLSAVSAR